jgi:hypothetical protein
MEQPQIFVQMALKAWNIQISRADKFFSALPDESFEKEIAPGKNRVIYLLGHLIAVNDSMISLFGLGDRYYAHFDEAFIRTPDKSGNAFPELADLKQHWKKSIEILDNGFAQLSADDWFGKHTAMTDEDLVNDPGRNKLSVLLNRTSHVAYHLGQLVLVK